MYVRYASVRKKLLDWKILGTQKRTSKPQASLVDGDKQAEDTLDAVQMKSEHI